MELVDWVEYAGVFRPGVAACPGCYETYFADLGLFFTHF